MQAGTRSIGRVGKLRDGNLPLGKLGDDAELPAQSLDIGAEVGHYMSVLHSSLATAGCCTCSPSSIACRVHDAGAAEFVQRHGGTQLRLSGLHAAAAFRREVPGQVAKAVPSSHRISPSRRHSSRWTRRGGGRLARTACRTANSPSCLRRCAEMPIVWDQTLGSSSGACLHFGPGVPACGCGGSPKQRTSTDTATGDRTPS